jgi:hypothetical protein
VQSRRPLFTDAVGEAWRAAGTGLRWAMCRRSCVTRWAGSAGSAAGVSSSPGIRRGSPYTSSATDPPRSVLYDVQIPRRTSGSASVHCWSAWHMTAAFRVRWKRSTKPLAAGWWAVVLESQIPHILASSGRIATRVLVSGDCLRVTEAGYTAGNEGACHGLGSEVRDGNCFWPAREMVDRGEAVCVAC